MSKRTLMFGALLLLVMGTAAVIAIWPRARAMVVWNFYPYFFPQHVCYTKNGTEVDSGQECLADRRKIIEERSIGGYYDPVLNDHIYQKCKLACQNNELCSRFIVGWPDTMYNKRLSGEPGVFQCIIVSSTRRP